MPAWVAEWWGELTSVQRTIVIVAFCLAGLGILFSFVFAGTDWSGFGEYIKDFLS